MTTNARGPTIFACAVYYLLFLCIIFWFVVIKIVNYFGTLIQGCSQEFDLGGINFNETPRASRTAQTG